MEKIKVGRGNNYLKKLEKVNGEESKTYKLESDEPIFRNGRDDHGNYYVFPFGGPCITEGSPVKDLGIVAQINDVEGYGFVITFE